MLFILQVVRVIEAFEMGFDRIQCKSLGKYFCTQNIFKNLRTTQCQCNYSDFKKSILYSVENVSDFYIISKRKTLIKYLSSKLQIYLIRCLYLDVSQSSQISETKLVSFFLQICTSFQLHLLYGATTVPRKLSLFLLHLLRHLIFLKFPSHR